MDKSLKASITALIKSRREFEFEALINKIYLIKHSSNGYQQTREKRDDGAEGIIISSKTVIAAYGPDGYNKRVFEKKINDDFDDYINKWAKEYPNWIMHYNDSLAPDQIRISDILKQKAVDKGLIVESVLVKGSDQIIHSIEEDFSNKQLRALSEFLGVSKELIIFDHIRSIIDDLIRGVDIDLDTIEYSLKVDISEKITLNYSPVDEKNANEEYEELAMDGTLKKIWGIISTYENEEINSLKLRIKKEFNALLGSFKEKLNSLTLMYLNRYANNQDDDFEYFTRALLIYCFEQCMIGDKTISENNKFIK